MLRIDIAVRDWSRRDKAVAERLRRVDNRRMDYMRSLFGAISRRRSRRRGALPLILYSLWIANHFIAADHGPRSRADVVRLALARLEA